jgi:hypothetical protein
MNTSFTKKLIDVNFVLGAGEFSKGGNTKLVSGLRVECQIEKNGHPSKNKMKMSIFGMLDEDMATITTFGPAARGVQNTKVQVRAGDENGMSTAFEGEITGAWEQYKSPPNLLFHVEALAGFFPALKPVPPRSYKGPTDAASIMAALAIDMGYKFENNGVSAQLSSPYLPGTAFQQASIVADAANLEFGVDDGIVFIAPRGTNRGGTAPLISPETGMDEYPIFDKKGIRVTSLYVPNLKLGGLVVVESAVTKACGTWRIVSLKHHLDSLKPGGKWRTEIKGSKVGD